jgi:hypothetical protein
MQADLPCVYYFLIAHTYLLDVCVSVFRLDDAGGIEARHEEVEVGGAAPELMFEYLFRFVVDVVDGGLEGYAFFVAEGAEDGDGAHVVVVIHLVVPSETCFAVFEVVLAFADGGCLLVEDIDVVDHSLLVDCVQGLFVAVADQCEEIGACFP